MSKVKSYVSLIRPFTLGAPFIGALFFSILALKYYGQLDQFWNYLPKILCGAISLSLANASSNVLNSVWDKTSDRISKPDRPVANGTISERDALTLGFAGIICVFFFASFVNTLFVLLVAIVMLCAFIYSAPPLRTKRILWINSITIAIPRGFIGILATFAIIGSPWHKPFLAIAAIMFVYVLGTNEVRNVPDQIADKNDGVRTLVNVYGTKRAMQISAVFVVIPYLMILFLVWRGWLAQSAIYLLLLIPIGIAMLYYMLWKPEQRKWDGNNVAWSLFYFQMMLYMIGFCAIYFM